MADDSYVAVTKQGADLVPASKIVDLERRGELRAVRGVNNEVVLKRFLVETLSDPRRRFCPNRFSKVYGVDRKVLKKWLLDKEINRAVRERVKEIVGGGVYLAKLYRKITRQALSGSYNHQRLIFEMVGEYKPGMKLEHEVTSAEQRFRDLETKRRAGLIESGND